MKINHIDYHNKFSNNMTKISYEKPMVVEELEIDTVDLLCTSDLNGGLDDVTRNEVDWAWGQE